VNADLVAALRGAGVSDVDDSALARALYSSDASLYRVLPRVVVRPRHVDEIDAVLAACRSTGVPLTARGAGTSIAGNAVGPGVVMDTSRHLGRVLEVDPERRTARVQPGVVHAALQRRCEPHGLRFGPDPSTHNRCTIGGMIGNNACGSRALGYGRTSDNVLALDAITGTGDRLLVGGTAADSRVADALRGVVAANLAPLRSELGRFSRQVSGYALEHLLPEQGFDLAKALVGSEGTLVLVREATVRLVAEPPARVLVVLGYPDVMAAADATPAVLTHRPVACEGLDRRIVRRAAGVPGAVVPDLPRGGGWLMVELAGDDDRELAARAAELVAAAEAQDALVVTEPSHAAALWRIREDGAGLATRAVDGRQAHPGWEDAAVPPASLGSYLRDFDALLRQHDLDGIPYGHFGDGCVHIRIDFPFGRRRDATAVFRAFLDDAAALVARYGGSISGEHGDGRARGELLPAMYSPGMLDLFRRVKRHFDPDELLNPGVLVDPAPVDEDIRAALPMRSRSPIAWRLAEDHGDLGAGVHRCIGIGRCRVDPQPDAVMCPSYAATRDEKDSTRGRARVLQEMLTSGGVVEGWRAPEVHAALDLCLACKGCKRDCPTGVDMAAYKSEVLHQAYSGRLRPRAHYTLGRLPVWADLAARAPRTTNAVLASTVGGALARRATGMDPRRRLPGFARLTFGEWWAARPARRPAGPPVALWVDTFTDHFSPEVGVAAVRVLERGGYDVRAVFGACCALTWISTGQLGRARRILDSTVGMLDGYASAGVPIVGLEPSCTATLRAEAPDLCDGEAVQRVAAATVTLAELMTGDAEWQPPRLDGVEVVAQPHCHHHAVLGWQPDASVLSRAGAVVTRLGGCCGLAGDWGVAEGHHDVSVAVAELQLLPALRAAGPAAVVLADGFSCRTQIAQLSARTGTHLAQLLAARLDA
jgi:FAD/FMN-containing dehydrogenase/Fe-S oxidoreductase